MDVEPTGNAMTVYVFSASQDRGIDETIFQNVNKLHLTIGTLTLLNEIEVSTAVELLHESSQYIRE